MVKFNRLTFLIFIMTFFYIMLVARLFYLQIIKGEYYREISDRNYIKVFYSNPPRGKIYDRNGVLLAYDVPTYNLTALPFIVKKNYSLNELDSNLRKYFNVNLDERTKNIIEKNLYPSVVIKKNLTQQDIENFYNYNYLFNGFYLEIVPKRVYTEDANYLAHIIGYVGYPSEKDLKENPNLSPNTLIGKAGVEKIYDSLLRGEPGQKAVLVDAFGRQKKVLWEKDPKKGDDIYLTIDIRIQKIAFDAFNSTKHPSGAVVLVNPNTNEILALLSYPIYNLQKFYEGFSKEEWRELTENKYKPLMNKVFSGKYPPGSIFKPLVSVAALNEKVITPETKVVSGSEFRIGKWVYRNWDKRGCGFINVSKALEMSCDTFFYQVGLKLGIENIIKYTKLFGIGERLNPDLESKIATIPNKEWKKKNLKQSWFHGDTVNLSIGQGYLTITPFDAVKIVVPIANGGNVLKPYILKAYFDNKTQKLIHTKPQIIKKINIKKWNLDAVRYGMFLVVYGPNGTAKSLKKVPVINAGKTGTAQVYSYDTRRKRHHAWDYRDHAWFIDFAPYNNPKIAGVVFIEHGESGGKVAAPVMAYILRRVFNENIIESE